MYLLWQKSGGGEKPVFKEIFTATHCYWRQYLQGKWGIQAQKGNKVELSITGEMALSKLTIGDLAIYTNKGIMVIEVEFDENLWHEILVKLTKFYSKSMIPEILTGHIKNHLG